MKNISNLRRIYEDKTRRTDSVANTEKFTEEEKEAPVCLLTFYIPLYFILFKAPRYYKEVDYTQL